MQYVPVRVAPSVALAALAFVNGQLDVVKVAPSNELAPARAAYCHAITHAYYAHSYVKLIDAFWYIIHAGD